MKNILLPLLFVVCVGCASTIGTSQPYAAYEDKNLRPDQIATVKGFISDERGLFNVPYSGILIKCIDGKSTFNFAPGYDNGFESPNLVTVKPGRHHMQVRYFHRKWSVFWSMWFDAVGGEEYAVKFSYPTPDTVRIWLENSRTKEVVSGKNLDYEMRNSPNTCS
ncbi:MAG: hypothetical protein QM776_15565 [Rhodocyclaceae bacterium]